MRNYNLFLNDIHSAAVKIMNFTNGMTEDVFMGDVKTIDAVIRNLEVIGEAIKNIPEELKKKYPDVEWKAIIAMRNIIVHEYFGVDLNEIWQTVQKDIPFLDEKILLILDLEKGA